MASSGRGLRLVRNRVPSSNGRAEILPAALLSTGKGRSGQKGTAGKLGPGASLYRLCRDDPRCKAAEPQAMHRLQRASLAPVWRGLSPEAPRAEGSRTVITTFLGIIVKRKATLILVYPWMTISPHRVLWRGYSFQDALTYQDAILYEEACYVSYSIHLLIQSRRFWPNYHFCTNSGRSFSDCSL